MGRRGEEGVSSVVGTVMMLSITMAVFGGLGFVVLDAVEEAPPPPRADLRVMEGDGGLLLRHLGGVPLATADLTVTVNVAGSADTVATAELEAALGEAWRIGETLCVSCLYDGADVRGARIITPGFLVLDHGEPGQEGPLAPDLVVEYTGTTPDVPDEGEGVAFHATVTNVGSQDVGAVTFEVQVLVDGAQAATTTVTGPLAVGASTDVTASSWTAEPGVHAIEVRVDSTDAVAESEEANNADRGSLTVLAGQADPGHPYEDTDFNGRYEDGVDVALTAADVQDGIHDAGANALVIPGSTGAISANSIDFRGTGITLAVDATATTSSGLLLTSSAGIDAAGVTLAAQQAAAAMALASQGDIDVTGTALHTSQDLTFDLGQTSHTLRLDGATLDDKDDTAVVAPSGVEVVGVPAFGGWTY